jgi:microfibrillar-associated protein 1
MPPPFSSSRGMTKNPLKPARYRPGKPIAEEPSSDEEEEEQDEEAAKEAQREQERRRRAEALRRRQQAPKATSFPGGAVAAQKAAEEDDEEGFVTDEEDKPAPAPKAAPTDNLEPAVKPASIASEEESEEASEEESSEEESSEDEAPRKLLRPTFIKKNARAAPTTAGQTQAQAEADLAATAEARRATQRQEKADQLIRDQLEKEAIARSSANRAWDYDELVEAEDEEAIDDTDGLDPEAERAAWTLRELKRVQRSREAIEASEKEREEIERRRNLPEEEREREDRAFIAKQKEERDATRGETGFMQRYFHKGAFFRDEAEAEGLDRRELMGARFEDEVDRDTLPQYMQVRDMTKLGKKGRTRYRDLKSEDTGRFGDGLENRRRREGPPVGVTDERFMPDRFGGDEGDRGPTGANASVVRPRRMERERERSPRRDRDERDRGRYERSRSRERRKRSPSPYDDREKRRRVDAES